MSQKRRPRVRLRPWSSSDLDLLHGLNTPEVKRYLGGPESPPQLYNRHNSYVMQTAKGRTYVILAGDRRVGKIGYWTTIWRDDAVYETGWGVLPEFQRRGFAVAATKLVVAELRREARHRHLLAFPSVENEASNIVCRKAGFTLVGECDYPIVSGTLSRATSGVWISRLSHRWIENP